MTARLDPRHPDAARPTARPGSPRAANYARVQLDSVFVGIISAAGTFLPVFLLRLGALVEHRRPGAEAGAW